MSALFSSFFHDYALSSDGRKRLLHSGSPVLASLAVGSSCGVTPSSPSAATEELPLTPEEFSAYTRALVPARGARFKDDHHDTCMYIERSKNLNVVAYTANYIRRDDAQQKSAAVAAAAVTGADEAISVNGKDPMRAYWIKIEPEHVARRRARGEMEDICSLNMIEKKLAYGCNVTVLSFEKFFAEVFPKPSKDKNVLANQHAVLREWYNALQPCVAKYVALPSMPVLLLHLPPHYPLSSPNLGKPPAFASSSTVPVMLTVIDKKLSILEKVYVCSVEPKRFYQLPSVEYIEAYGVALETGESTYERMSK